MDILAWILLASLSLLVVYIVWLAGYAHGLQAGNRQWAGIVELLRADVARSQTLAQEGQLIAELVLSEGERR